MSISSSINFPELRFDCLIYREDNLWVAHCLQLDVVGTSPESKESATDTMIELMNELLIDAWERDDLEHFQKAAPPEMFQRFYKGELIGTRNALVELPFKAPDGPRRVNFQQAFAHGAHA